MNCVVVNFQFHLKAAPAACVQGCWRLTFSDPCAPY